MVILICLTKNNRFNGPTRSYSRESEVAQGWAEFRESFTFVASGVRNLST
jgi:hypothetical protein